MPTTGLAITGESGWHTHGSGEDKDYDMDLAIILNSTEPISTSMTTMVALMMPMGEITVLADRVDEVLLWEYVPFAVTNSPSITWNLTQGVAVAQDAQGTIINSAGNTWSDLFTLQTDAISPTYVKTGTKQDSAYWSENVGARITESQRVALVLERPSLSNTVILKTGITFKAEIAVIQKPTNINSTGRAYAKKEVVWYFTDASFSGAASLIGSSSVALASAIAVLMMSSSSLF